MFFMCLHVQTVNGLVPEYLTSRFVTQNESHYALRDSVNKLVVYIVNGLNPGVSVVRIV